MKNMIDNKKLIKIVMHHYKNDKRAIRVQARELGIGRPRFEKIISENYTYTPLTRKNAWEIYRLTNGDMTMFSRHFMDMTRKNMFKKLVGAVYTDKELENMVKDNILVKEIVKRIDMPFININRIHNILYILKVPYNKEYVKNARVLSIKSHWLDKTKKNNTLEKRKSTNTARYGFENQMQSIEIKKKIKLNKLYFTPTPYVKTKEQAITITETPETLEKFLKETFPEQEQFTLHEIALITGRVYNAIKSRFNINLSFIKPSQQGHLPEQMQSFLEDLGYEPGKDFIVNDRQAIKPLEIDFYFPKQKVGIEVNDFATHNATVNPFGGDIKPKKYHMEKSKLAKEKGIRLIHAWEQYFSNPNQLAVLKNAIKHALGISKNRVYARNTYVKEVPNRELRTFFNENNIQGFRGANKAYALFDKKTDEVLMAYSVGASHFAHNKYDMEIIRGASKLDTTIVGGASKLWKFIVDSNLQVNSIVYYIDRNIYNGSSISSLEGHLTLLSTQEGFWNYFVEEDTIKNRQPAKHKEIKELVKQGKVWEIYNAGTETYVWNR